MYPFIISGLIAMFLLALPVSSFAVLSKTARMEQLSSRPASQISSAEGDILNLELQSTVPSLRLKAERGAVVTVYLDRASTTVWENNRSIGFEGLKTGQKVKIRFVFRNEKKPLAKSIEILE